MTGNTKLQAVNALTVIREQEAEIYALTAELAILRERQKYRDELVAERDELLARVEQFRNDLRKIIEG